MKLMKITGYLSLLLGGLIILNSDLLGALPYIFNAIFAFRYAEKTYKNREFMIAYAAIMLVLNLVTMDAFLDVGLWGLFLYAWIVS